MNLSLVPCRLVELIYIQLSEKSQHLYNAVFYLQDIFTIWLMFNKQVAGSKWKRIYMKAYDIVEEIVNEWDPINHRLLQKMSIS